MASTAFPVLDRPQSLSRRAYQMIRQAIRDGVVVADELYSENELASSLGISRTPVREALIELSREGLVEIAPQRGFRLRRLGPEERQEVFDLRRVLEAFVVDRLARVATDEDVAQLRVLLGRQAKVVDDPVQFMTIDEEFHLVMPQMVGLARTHDMVSSLRGAMWLVGSMALALPERGPEVLREHGRIVDAIAAHDSAAAAKALRAHIERTAVAAKRPA